MQLHAISTRLAGVALLLLAAAAPAAAADPVQAPAENNAVSSAPAHAVKPSADEPKRICRSIETTSSRLKTKKVCLTREQWRNAKYN